MPIESIEFAKNTEFNKLTMIAGATLASLGILSTQADATPRPAPSGETCAQKVAYYAGQGALFGKVKVSDCKNRSQIKNNILQIEEASRFFDYNPVGGVAVAACESTIYEKARNKSGASGLFQQMPQYWSDRLSITKSYIKKHSRNSNPKLKLVNDALNPKSNSFVSVYMLARKSGPNDWAPSRHCWNKRYQEVAGSKDRLMHWFATAKPKK